MAEDNTTPTKIVLAFLESLITTEEININKKAEKINQKVPISNIVPKNDTEEAEEKKAERNTDTTINKPERIIGDLGKLTLPSENLATVQKIIEMAKPMTSRRPLEISTGIFVKGRTKIGKSTTTNNKAKKEILSKRFDNIFFIILNNY